MKANQTNKINSLQVYRGVAAVLVVLFHVTVYAQDRFNYRFLGGVFSFGYTGVDFFFVLSGFIIFFNHAKDVGFRHKIWGYAVKRLIRVFPIYWMVTIAKIFAIILIPTIAKAYEKEISTIVKSLFLIPQVNPPIIGAAWTLSYEMLFYLLFGILIGLGWRRGLYIAGIWFISILGFVFGTKWGLSIPDHYLLTFFFNERNFEFILGCCSAYVVLNHKLRYPGLIAIAGGLLFAVAGWSVTKNFNVESYTLLFGIPSLLLVTGSAAIEFKNSIALPKPLVFIGEASYSIYLTHAMFVNVFSLIVNTFVGKSIGNPSVITLAMAMGAVLGGLGVYQFIERPLLSMLRARTTQSPKPVVINA